MLTRMASISWPRNPPASASLSAGITGVSHRAQSHLSFLKVSSSLIRQAYATQNGISGLRAGLQTRYYQYMIRQGADAKMLVNSV